MQNNEVQDLPFVSVIMPIRNEVEFIENAIKNLCKNNYPCDKLEIIVVDGMSEDGTRDIVKRLAGEDKRIRLLDNPKMIVPSALNIGVKACSGEIFIRVDGHAEMDSNFIINSTRALQEHPEAWVVGGSINTIGLSYVGAANAAAMRSPFGIGNARFRIGNFEGYVEHLAFGTYHMWIFDKIGYFDEDMIINEDDDLALRITRAGGKTWMSKSIQSTYFARDSLRKLAIQYWRYGFWRTRTMQKHKMIASFRQIIPVVFVTSCALLTIGGILWQPLWYLLAAELALYFLALIIGAAEVGAKSGWKFLPIVPVVFVILHFSYGLGNLWGIVKFIFLGGYNKEKLKT